MLHGIGAHADYFRFQLAALSARWRVIAWNAPGYGLSDDLRNCSCESPNGRYNDVCHNQDETQEEINSVSHAGLGWG